MLTWPWMLSRCYQPHSNIALPCFSNRLSKYLLASIGSWSTARLMLVMALGAGWGLRFFGWFIKYFWLFLKPGSMIVTIIQFLAMFWRNIFKIHNIGSLLQTVINRCAWVVLQEILHSTTSEYFDNIIWIFQIFIEFQH